MNLTQKIEAYLFYTGEAIEIKKLGRVFDMNEGLTREALRELEESLVGRGIVLVKNGDEVMLATHPDMADVIQGIKKQELSDPLSKSAIETLAIIAYKDGATKPDIDFIRGVNSGFMLRNLLVRGLVEKVANPDDKRVAKYRVTMDTLRYMGVSDVSELPHRAHFQEEMEKRESAEPVSEPNVFTS